MAVIDYPHRILSALTNIADAGWELLAQRKSKRPELLEKPLSEACRELLSSVGEATGTAIARNVMERYEQLTPETKPAFFKMLSEEFSADEKVVSKAIYGYQADPGPASLQELTAAAEPPRQELFRRLNMAPDGTKALVRMRQDILDARRTEAGLDAVDWDLKHLLVSWFNRGFLELREINWDTPAAVLEKLIEYEAVHEIRGWADLRRRLQGDRRCYGFFHPGLPGEPLIFVEVALLNEIAGRVQPLIGADAPKTEMAYATTAVFYSISNCQKGLRGISFGNFLIKQVVQEIRRDFPKVSTFATLSPVPGFLRWLAGAGADGTGLDASIRGTPVTEIIATPGWQDDLVIADEVREVLVPLCAHYLVRKKMGGMPPDPVARFHLNNGARLERINWMADTSDRGLAQSAGIMVNYLYKPADIVRNHEDFSQDGKVAASASVLSALPEQLRHTG